MSTIELYYTYIYFATKSNESIKYYLTNGNSSFVESILKGKIFIAIFKEIKYLYWNILYIFLHL